MPIIDAEGNVSSGDAVPAPFQDRYQGHIFADPRTLEAMLGASAGIGGWVVTTITREQASRAVIQGPGAVSCRGLPGWEVIGPDGTLGPVVKALMKATAAAGMPSAAATLALTRPSTGAHHV